MVMKKLTKAKTLCKTNTLQVVHSISTNLSHNKSATKHLSRETNTHKTTAQKLLLMRLLFQVLTSLVLLQSSGSAVHMAGCRNSFITDGLTASGHQPLHIVQPLSVINSFPIGSKTLWKDQIKNDPSLYCDNEVPLSFINLTINMNTNTKRQAWANKIHL